MKLTYCNCVLNNKYTDGGKICLDKINLSKRKKKKLQMYAVLMLLVSSDNACLLHLS